MNQELVSVPDALKIIPVSREALYRKLKSGKFPHYRFGAKIMVCPDEILASMRVPNNGSIHPPVRASEK
ncbi:MAG: helix-turn-helix domain-containing protein [Nitrospirales bacterium]|nr:helix-turn-helix domain-containing protein [Nitrospirales bacterium]